MRRCGTVQFTALPGDAQRISDMALKRNPPVPVMKAKWDTIRSKCTLLDPKV